MNYSSKIAILFLVLCTAFTQMCGLAFATENFAITKHIKVKPDPGIMKRIGLNLGLADGEGTYAIALITGVDEYPLLGQSGEVLDPASTDLSQLTKAFQSAGFNEIVVLWNDDFNAENLKAVLREYVDIKLAKQPKSRFLLAHTGHGIAKDQTGYLMTTRSDDFVDISTMVSLPVLKNLISPTLDAAFQSLVLINSCYGGTFMSAFGGKYIPQERGAHAITAGASDELTWGTKKSGSVFFERVVRGLQGAADTLPKAGGGDGSITTFELYSFLRQTVQSETNHTQHPKIGKVRAEKNNGEFFFVVPTNNNVAANKHEADSARRVSFGSKELTAYRGQIKSPKAFVQVGLNSSLPQKTHTRLVNGGTMDLSVLFDGKSDQLFFRDIAFRSKDIIFEFDDSVQVGIANPVKKDVKVRLDFNVFVRLDRRPPALKLQPGQNGIFKLDDFYTSHCNFSCYDVEVSGRWFIEVNGISAEGRIASFNNNRGVGADVRSSINSKNFPSKLTFSEFNWHGNHNKLDGSFPALVEQQIDDVLVRVEAPLISFAGHGPNDDGTYLPVELEKLN